MNGLTFEPPIPLSLWLATAALGAAMLVWYALRRPGVMSRARWAVSLTLMSAALVVVLVLLLNPTWSREVPPVPGKPALVVLLDASGSMETSDSDNGQTRYAAAVKVARQMNDELGTTFDVQVKSFDESTRTVSPGAPVGEANGASTDIAAAVLSTLAKDNPAGQAIVLLSDGIHNAGGGAARVIDAIQAARALDAPVYTRTFGGQMKTVDLAVQVRASQDLALVGQHLPLTAQVTYTGLVGGRANVSLLLDGKPVARRTVDLTASGSADVHFMVTHERVGVYPYEVRVDPLLGEASQTNNSAAYVLRVVDEPIRVLVLEGKPYWDSKFFTRTLTADPAIALDMVVRLTDARLMRRVLTHERKSADATTLPTSVERAESWQIESNAKDYLGSADRLRGYQVVVLGRDVEPFLSDAAVTNLEEWVARDGGSLVCYRGSPTASANQLLAKIMPVRWTPSTGKETRFRLALTDRGNDMDWLRGSGEAGGNAALSALPSLSSATVVDSARPLAVVLAQSTNSEGTRAPAVVYQPYGTGRVAVIEGSGMWRWAFLAPANQNQEEVYASIWHSLMRWLTSNTNLQPGQTFSLRADKVRYAANEHATATLLTRGEIGAGDLPRVQLMTEGSNEPGRLFVPAPMGEEAGIYRVDFGVLAEGRYRASLQGAKPDDATTQIVFDVRKYDREQLDREARPDLMRRIAQDSGGSVLSRGTPDELAGLFQAHQTRARPPQFVRTAAWDRWWILGGVIGLWTVSWVVRRSSGLV